MELSQEEKDRIVAEEKLRMETRKDFLKENFGHRGPWGMRHGMCGGHGCHRCGGGFFKAILLIAVVFAACHFWHHSCYSGPCGYGAPYYYAPQQAPAQPPVTKN